MCFDWLIDWLHRKYFLFLHCPEYIDHFGVIHVGNVVVVTRSTVFNCMLDCWCLKTSETVGMWQIRRQFIPDPNIFWLHSAIHRLTTNKRSTFSVRHETSAILIRCSSGAWTQMALLLSTLLQLSTSVQLGMLYLSSLPGGGFSYLLASVFRSHSASVSATYNFVCIFTTLGNFLHYSHKILCFKHARLVPTRSPQAQWMTE